MRQLDKLLAALDKTMDEEDAQGLVYAFLAKYSESYLDSQQNEEYYNFGKGEDEEDGTC